MRGATILLIVALISFIAYSGVIVDSTTPLITLQPTQRIETSTTVPIVFQYGTITVPKQLWFIGLHGLAYKQITYLYPLYKNLTIKGCSYTVYGPSRIYAFDLLGGSGQLIKVYSSVQNNEEVTGEQTQETAVEEAKAEISAKDANKNEVLGENNAGFNVIKLSRAYEIPRIAIAIKEVTRNNWKDIRSAPLVRCLEKWSNGVYSFRLYFDGVPKWFEYRQVSEYSSQADEIEGSKSNLRSEDVSSFYDSQIAEAQSKTTVESTKPSQPQVSSDEEYLPRQQPIFSVNTVNGYGLYTLQDFKKHPGYTTVFAGLNDHFGRFEEQWISKIQYKVDVEVHYFQIQVQFVPFLCNVDLEAHYYGSTSKAAILQIDEKTFDSRNYLKNVDSWGEIKEFNSYKAFKEANDYVLSQFTYLRFYKVIAAYSALHKNGRYVRLVYQSEKNFFTPNGEQQFNILVYICDDGKFYIEREDFLATNTQSQGYAGWLALFVDVNNFSEKQAYKNIVKYFVNLKKTFWDANKVDEVQANDDIYVIKFKNPKEGIPVDQIVKRAVFNTSGADAKPLNHFEWTSVDENSVYFTKATGYLKEKYPGYTPMFVNTFVSPYGRHFEVSHLTDKKVFANAYFRYVDAQDLINDDEWQGVAYEIDFNQVPLPVNPEETLTKWLSESITDLVSIVEVKNSSKNSYQCVGLTRSERWRINVNWVKGQWIISNKELINDGYYFVTGYPSVATASATGYLARLYPSSFNSQWVYSAIEIKNIGYFVYNRVIYRLGNVAYQGIVRTTIGVENSHSLVSWDRVRYLRDEKDYGYGINYDWSYGLNSKYFFDYSTPAVILTSQVNVTVNVTAQVEVVDKTNLLCTYWDNGTCLSCSGDYYADDNGVCVKVDDECEYWKVSGICARCSYGWAVNNQGRCVSQKIVKVTKISV